MTPGFTIAAVPPIRLEAGGIDALGALAAELAARGHVVVITDRQLATRGVAARAVQALEAAGFSAAVYDALEGEPKIAQVRAATDLARGADLVVGLGGGSPLDVAKIAAAVAPDGRDPMAFAGAASPLPERRLPKILVPTTAGTGAESSSTAIFSGEAGRKLWIWGPETKAERILLDPALAVTKPAGVTAATGLDAFVHAFEAATNRHTHAGAQTYAHEAMRLVARALPMAVAEPENLSARAEMALGACYAGVAIDNCGTAIAHNISHALAGLAPVPHGLATALAFEATLPWLVAEPTPAMERAATALGLDGPAALPGFVTALMDAAGIARRLPPGFDAIAPHALVAEMSAPENAPMRRATAREVRDADLARFAAAMLALGGHP